MNDSPSIVLMDGPPASILDLGDDLLAAVAEHAEDAQTRCRLAASCAAFRRLILCDVRTRALVWNPLVRIYRPLKADRLPSPMLYQSLSSLQRLSWRPLSLEAPRSIAQHALAGRTGAASCRLEGVALVYGGTLNGNIGPLLGDLLRLAHDRINGLLSIRPAREQQRSREAHPGPRRGHTMTASSVGGSPVAVVLGGWGSDGEETMMPHLLSATPDGYEWSLPALSGALPTGRAFHSATETAPGRLVAYGGLGSGCCRDDLALLDLSSMEWTSLRIGGVPRCSYGRAGHCAVFVPHATGVLGGGMAEASSGGAEADAPGRLWGDALDSGADSQAGHLIFMSGASRSIVGDAHQPTVDAIEVGSDGSPLRWSAEPEWGDVSLPAVRTAACITLARHVVVWGGVGQDHTPEGAVRLLDVDRRSVRPASLLSTHDSIGGGEAVSSTGLHAPPPRAGAIFIQLGPEETILMFGSDHEDEEDMLTPYLLQLELP